jgi:DNA-3-methyladenine glycosylase
MRIIWTPQSNSLSDERLEKLFSGCVDKVARDLIGLFLFNESDGNRIGGLIIETEAYCAPDPAAHCHVNAHRNRSSGPMLRAGGHIYRHYSRGGCLNLTSGEEGKGSAVLIRALYPQSFSREKVSESSFDKIANGPVKLCRFLQFGDAPKNLKFDKRHLSQTTLKIYARNSSDDIIVRCGSRVNLSKKSSKDWPRNFVLAQDPFRSFLSPGARRNFFGKDCPRDALGMLKLRDKDFGDCARACGCL